MKCWFVRRFVIITLGLCLGLFTTANTGTSPQTQPSIRAFKVAPSYFIPNAVPSKNSKGQSAQLLKGNPEAIAFIQTRKGRVIFTPTGAYIGMQINIPNGRPEKLDTAKSMKPETGHPDETKIKTVVMKTGFSVAQIKAQRTPEVHMEELTGGKVNFLVGAKENWHTNIPTYRKLVYDNVWTGIDVEYIGYMDRLEYRVQLEPGADPNQINMETGAKKLILNENGSLTAELEGGQLTMSTPKAWQNIDGKQLPVDVDFQPLDNGKYTFTIGTYDPTYPLTIDPVLSWSTYLVDKPGEGTGNDEAAGIAVDSAGAAYITGITDSSDFPTTAGALQTVYHINQDAFVTKLSPDGGALVYSTYLGGSGTDFGQGIAVDSSGAAYVTGWTSSPNFPATSGAFQLIISGGRDAFVTKLSMDGSTLDYSTYLGGSSEDRGSGIAVDSTGAAYVIGSTGSSDFPTTDGAFQMSFGGGVSYVYDAFVTKLSIDGSVLAYSTYLGGSGDEEGHGIAVDGIGEAYVTGHTGSSDFPTTAGALQTAFSGGGYYPYDAFVTKLSPNGSTLGYSTYLGGSDVDFSTGIAVNTAGEAYVTGLTSSTDFPTTAGAFGPTAVGENDTFVTKLSADGGTLGYSTYLGKTSQGGSSSSDAGDGIAVDSTGAVYVTGYTYSSDFPTTTGAFETIFSGGGNYGTDAFVTKLSPGGSTLYYSTYLGGSSDESGSGIAVDSVGAAYVTGLTDSSDFPITTGAFQQAIGGGSDAFVTKLSADGNALLYSTYLGGSEGDGGRAIALSSAGSAYITGVAQSSDFPTTGNAFQTAFGGGRDVFVTKLSADGNALVYSTYLGGSEFDNGNSIAVDSAGAAYVTGNGLSPDFPTTTGAFQTTFSGEGDYGTDAFITKVSMDGSTLDYSTYLGGSNEERGTGIAVDSAGVAYVTGYTGSPDFPTTAGAFQTVIGGSTDAFVTKLSEDGSTLDYSTYLGGTDSDYGASIAINSNGAAYVTGDTSSSDFPTTVGVFGITAEGYDDAFVIKLLPDGSALLYSTYLGGMNSDFGDAIAVDSNGAAYVTGGTSSSDFPTTVGAFGTTAAGHWGYNDVFVATLDFSGEVFHWITGTAGAHGTIFPVSKDVVEGSDATFTIAPDIGYQVSDVQVDGVSVGAVASYNFNNVTADHTISASFALQPPLTLPLPTLLYQGKTVSFLDSIDTLLVNPYAEDASVTIEGRDENGQITSQTNVTVTGNGSLQVNPLTEGTGEPTTLWAQADRHLLVFERLHHPNGEMTAYLNTPLQHQLTVPHVAEETDWWDTWAYLSNTDPRSLTLKLAGQDEDLQVEPSMYVNLEAHLPNPVSENDAWGQIVSGSDYPISNTNTLSGFEMFIRKDSDGAACELVGKASYTLLIPHIPEETDIFWTGFAVVNVEEEAALTTWTFYTDNGTVVGIENLTIPPESKLKGLKTELFPDEAASARWATISSDRKLAGIEIYGTHNGGICGLVLPDDSYTAGILPDVRTREGEWTGIAITNPMTANAHVSIQLVNAAGVVKANRTETIAPLHRFKTVVADYFTGIVIDDGDTVRFLSDQPVLALEVCGDLDRTFMTALTTGR